MLLLDWNYPMTWTTNQVANVINIFIAIGTIGTLFLLYQEQRRNRKRMDALEKQNELTQLQIKTDNAPDLVAEDFVLNDRVVQFVVTNKGRTATITNISCHEDFTWDDIKLPLQLPQGDSMHFTGWVIPEKGWLTQTPKLITILYNDIHSHKYECLISLEKTRVDLWVKELQ